MKQITCVFFGKSGSGKGTQADLLLKKLAEIDTVNKAIYVETGARFRSFVKDTSSFTAHKVKEVMSAGGLMPAFFPVWMWTGLLIDEIVTGNEHMVLDGLSRRPDEAPILDSAIQFYQRKKPIILFLDVHHHVAKDRLLKRGRHDDKHEEIDKRLAWFDSEVMKAVSYFKHNPYYTFISINGDQTIENVHKDIVKALEL
jgi:adenylate kinase family enzyme